MLIPVILKKKGQGHHTWYELLDPKQGYNCTNFERPLLNSVRQKPISIFFGGGGAGVGRWGLGMGVGVKEKSENTPIISLNYMNMCKGLK